jgi:hypothetical protein
MEVLVGKLVLNTEEMKVDREQKLITIPEGTSLLERSEAIIPLTSRSNEHSNSGVPPEGCSARPGAPSPSIEGITSALAMALQVSLNIGQMVNINSSVPGNETPPL